jgi:hypothetical protein
MGIVIQTVAQKTRAAMPIPPAYPQGFDVIS